jgi:hypothetical protein
VRTTCDNKEVVKQMQEMNGTISISQSKGSDTDILFALRAPLVTIKKYSETDAEDEWNNQHQQIQGFRY